MSRRNQGPSGKAQRRMGNQLAQAVPEIKGNQAVQVQGRALAKEINRLIDKGDAILDAGTVYVKKGGLFVPVKLPK